MSITIRGKQKCHVEDNCVKSIDKIDSIHKIECVYLPKTNVNILSIGSVSVKK